MRTVLAVSDKAPEKFFEAGISAEIPLLGRHDAVLSRCLGALQRRPAAIEQPFQRHAALRHEARDAGTDGEVSS